MFLPVSKLPARTLAGIAIACFAGLLLRQRPIDRALLLIDAERVVIVALGEHF